MPGALARAGMEGTVVGLDWQMVLAVADANGIDRKLAVLLLQPVEFKLVRSLTDEGDYEF